RSHREETIEQAAEFWDCNKTRALLLSADFAPRIVPRIEQVLAREDLTSRQKREIAETLEIPGTLTVSVDESSSVELE
ncbi:MAG: hypothetical protein ABEI86_01415, partial [Halobacteriaceae archaeon]